MQKQVRVLILEDNSSDAELVQRELRKAGLDFISQVAADRESYLRALDALSPDLILADYSLPGFDGLSALTLARQRRAAIPVIIVSGAIGEETAIEALKAGATDYVLKQRLSRLGPVVRRTLQEAAQHAEVKRAEEELARQQELMRVTLTSIGDAVIACDTEARVTFLNPVAADLTGWNKTDAVGRQVDEIFMVVDAKSRTPAEDPIARVLSDKCIFAVSADTALLRRDGREIPVEHSAAPILDDSGNVVGVVLVFHDVTSRRQAQKALWESEERFRLLVQGVKDHAIFMLDPEGRVATWNAGAEYLKGYAAQEIMGQGFSQFYTPEDVAEGKPQRELGIAAERGEYSEEGWRMRKDGSRFWAAVTITAVFDEAGGLRGFAKLTHDMSERKRVEEALKEAKKAAEEANRAKGLFLANVSHELRTPMNAILGMIDMALPRAEDPTLKDCLQTARESADLLLTLLNDLLDTSKIEQGKLALESAPFSLRRALDQVSHVLSVRAREKGLGFSFHVPKETPDALRGDGMRLQQVLINLVGNAVKFTERGEVEVRVRTLWKDTEACLEFAVRDTGIGIAAPELDRIFLPFSQADASTTRRFGGTGLGLSISRSLVTMMGGRIWVESEVGKGSTFFFTIRLPVADPAATAAAALPDISAAAPRPLRILLAEDNPANQKLVGFALRERGHAVEIAGNGAEAVRMVQGNRYDAILMDVQMPGMDGLEATHAIRAGERGLPRLPIIAMTAHAMKGDRERCLAAGMTGYLTKPINRHEMVALLESLPAPTGPEAVSGAAAVAAAPPVPPATTTVFDPAMALEQCFHSRKMLEQMIGYFFEESSSLIPRMREALGKGDRAEIARLGHRMKGTVVYLGAQPATEAVLVVETACRAPEGTTADAAAAIDALERECNRLAAAVRSLPQASAP